LGQEGGECLMCRRRSARRLSPPLLARERSRSRSRRRQPAGAEEALGPEEAGVEAQPFLCVLLGGPGSGKTSLGLGLQRAFPRLCHVSCGDLARTATGDGARCSPLLSSIGRQLADRRRRKVAGRRLADIVNAILADGLRSCPGLAGLVVDGVRAGDLNSLGAACGGPVACVVRLDCPQDVMLARLRERSGREGDEKLGLADGVGNEGRVNAYLQRAAEEDLALRDHLGARYESVVHVIDGTRPPHECQAAAEEAVRAAAQGRSWLRLLDSLEAAHPSLHIDWARQLADTAARLDEELHPDGRPRPRLFPAGNGGEDTRETEE